jgi:hypothetical protein
VFTGAEADFMTRAVAHFDEQRTRMAALEAAMSVLLDRTRSIHRGLRVALFLIGIALGTLLSIFNRML